MRIPTLFSTCLFLILPQLCSADVFTVITQNGETEKYEAELIGSGQGSHALEMTDGSIKIVPQGAVRERVLKAPPKPVTNEEMVEKLTKEFGEDLFRSYVKHPYVIGLVLAAPVGRSEELKVKSLLRRAGSFMKTVEISFEKYAKRMKLPLEDPEFPLVLIVFESDVDFEKYAQKVTGGRGLSAGSIAGFYYGLTNWLAVRLSECQTFEVPLHEAIHQQVFNRKVFNRLAPVPAWFNEGIATGFEGSGDRIDVDPSRVNSNFARRAMNVGQINWQNVVSEDDAFRGDVLASEAYTHGWSIHWMLATQYPEEYTNYVAMLKQKPTLGTDTPQSREAEFAKLFGKDVNSIQREFPAALRAAVRKQKIVLNEQKRPGFSFTQSKLGEVEMSALSVQGVLRVGGKLKNVSPIRDMDFYIAVVTGSGTYADWYVPNLRTSRIQNLKPQTIQKTIPGAVGGRSQSFRVFIFSAVPGTDDATAWAAGRFPNLGN